MDEELKNAIEMLEDVWTADRFGYIQPGTICNKDEEPARFVVLTIKEAALIREHISKLQEATNGII